MSNKLGGLLAGIKKAVLDANQSVAEQHFLDLQRYFVPTLTGEPDAPVPKFPEGEWSARTVSINVPREVSQGEGKPPLVMNTPVEVPLITLVPLRGQQIERLELLTHISLSASSLTPEQLSGGENISPEVNFSFDSGNDIAAELKIVISATDPPESYARIVRAFDKLLNAQLPT